LTYLLPLFIASYITVIHVIILLEKFWATLNELNLSFNPNYFAVIATILATLLAIVFSISLFVVSNSSDKYSYKIAEYYRKSFWTVSTLGITLFTIIAAVIFLILELNHLCITVTIFILFVISILFFGKYYFEMISVINPNAVVTKLKNECINSIKNYGNNKKSIFSKIEELIGNIGSVAAKLIIADDFESVVKTNSAIAQIHHAAQDSSLSEKEKNKLSTLSFNQLSIMLQIGVDHKVRSRKIIMSKIIDLIDYEKFVQTQFNYQLVEQLIIRNLFDSNRYLIGKDDFELFQSSIHDISVTHLCNVYEYESIKNKLYEKFPRILYKDYLISFQNDVEYTGFFIDHHCLKNFENIKSLSDILQHHHSSISSEMDKRASDLEIVNNLAVELKKSENEIIDIIKNQKELWDSIFQDSGSNVYLDIYTLFSVHQINKIYLQIGAYILFIGNNKLISPEIYIKELWDHTNPDDSDAFIINQTPVSSSTEYLTVLRLYGGNNTAGYDFLPFGLGMGSHDYHGIVIYLNKYYLLAITRCILKGNPSFNLPGENEIQKFAKNEQYKLNYYYEFASDFINESKSLISSCDELIAESEKWDLLFRNQGNIYLNKTKEWIIGSISSCEELINNIIKYSEPDPRSIQKSIDAARDGYKNNSKIDILASVRKFDEKKDANLDFFKIYQYRVGKKEWYLPQSNIAHDHILESYGRDIAFGETKHIIEKIFRNFDSEKLILETDDIFLIWDNVIDIIRKMRENGLHPNVAFIPSEICFDLINNNIYEYNGSQILEGEPLDVIHSMHSVDFQDIIILDKSAGEWIFKPQGGANDPFYVNIEPYPEKPEYMKILAFTIANYQIINPNCVHVIKLNHLVPELFDICRSLFPK